MMSRAAVRTIGTAAFVSVVAVGVVVLMTASDLDPGSSPARPAWWWTAYLLYVVVFLVMLDHLPRPPGVTDDALVVAAVALGIAVFMLYPDPGWTAIVLVVTAAGAAFVWPPRAVVAVIAVQTAAVGLAFGIGVATKGWPVSELVLSVLADGSFQFFAALLVRTARREAEARTDLAVAHAELRAAYTLLEVTSRDAERLRISRDLHDVLGHKLTALVLELEVASHLVSGTGAEHVSGARTIAKDLLGDVRATVGRMRESGRVLEPMLHSLARDVPGLDVSLQVVEAGPVEGDQAQVVLRCVQEAITNTLRHSGAEQLHVTVVADASGICVETRDDGWGTAVIVPGNGLTGMRERFQALGGSLHVGSSPGHGFTATGRLPARIPAGRST
ncbi:sensor histidine kinase [Blastococcus xanthinilyticus]|uniref:Signal transduction histidine kinase n=1 Tax=Blastococcus xanthinilyticus TaxID=1564164 RepID=A0A5S5CZ58_9ACTN|nr:sensor histidine kinase [Blastococcus xanthinilyticus]TYP89047.1 signal transduction histidine kinase [Blastococcus xanthinilyticus]